MGLAFFIRAGAGNVATNSLALSTILAEQILFVIAYILLLDCSITLMRDIYITVRLTSADSVMNVASDWLGSNTG